MRTFSPYRIAIVTGAFGLLGRQHTIALRQIGYKVFALDNNTDSLDDFNNFIKLEDGQNEMVVPLIVDLCNESEIQASIRRIIEQEGRLDSLVNNAAYNPVPSISRLSERVESFQVDSWDKEVQIGLTATILMVKYSIPHMRAGGSIVNLASDLAVIAPDQRIYENIGKDSEGNFFVKPLAYSIIKNGMIGMTKYLSTYLAARQIRVNAISPGGVYANQEESFVQALENRIPLGRMSHVSEFRGAIQFLCSDASSYMTGQNLIVDGGRTVW